MKKRLYLLILVCMFTYIPVSALAHPGGTDQYGGHHDYNNVSGLGNYHYHHGLPAHLHENGVCPYEGEDPYYSSNDSSSSTTATKAAPAVPEDTDAETADTDNRSWLSILALILGPILMAAVCAGIFTLIFMLPSLFRKLRSK